MPVPGDGAPADRHHLHLSRIVQDVWRYGAGMALSRVLAVLTLPIATHLFRPADFGIIELLNSLSILLTTVCLFGVDSAMEALYLDPKYAEERTDLVSSGLWFLAVLAVVAVGAAAVVATPLAHLTFGDAAQGRRGLLVVATLIAGLGTMSKYGSYIARLQFRAWAVTTISFFSGVGGIMIALAFVQVAGPSVRIWQFGLLAGGAIALLVSLYMIRLELRWTMSGRLLRVILPLAYPFFASSIVAVLAGTIERYLLAGLGSVEQVGLYAVAARLSSYLGTLLSTLSMAWAPLALKIYYDNDRFEPTYRKGLTYFMAGASFIAIGLTTFSLELVALLTTRAYAGSVVAVGVLCFAVVAANVPMITTVGLIVRKRAGLVFGIGVLSLVVNVVVSLALIPRWGILGAAIATAAGQVAFAWASYAMTERLLAPFRFDGRAALLVATTAAVYIGLLSWASVAGVPIAVRVVAWLTFLPALILTGIASRADLDELKVIAGHVMAKG